MLDYAYRQLLDQVEQLTPDQQLQLVQDVLAIYRRHAVSQPLHNVMEFKGLDKDIWQGIDVKKYIDEERDSWGG
ncbi:MAG: hypothetical protein M3Y39_05880 [Chloroflexota bacterium]|nr:hypothetical protein [Chloroflexota bacterium]